MLRLVARPRRLGALAAVAAFPVLGAAAVSLDPGTTYDFSIRSQSSQSGNRESVIMSGRGTFAGGSAKIEITSAQAGQDGESMFGSRGSYFLVLDGGQKMLLVDPAQKAYMEWDLQNMLKGMTRMMGALGGLVRMEMTDVRISAQEMGSGGTVNGYATTHVRMVENYTVNARVMGRSSSSRTETTTDYYFAPELRNLRNPFVQNSQAFRAMGDMFNNQDYQTQMAAAQAKLNGVPVKTVARTVTTQPDGKQETSIVTMEMTNFRSGDVAASTFAIPSGFQVVQMPSFDATAGANAQAGTGAQAGAEGAASIGEAAREGAAEGAREATKDAAKGAVRGAIGGLRGRIKK